MIDLLAAAVLIIRLVSLINIGATSLVVRTPLIVTCIQQLESGLLVLLLLGIVHVRVHRSDYSSCHHLRWPPANS